MNRLQDIDARRRNAEIDSEAETGSIGGWAKHYDKDGDRDQMRRDFIWMRRYIDTLLSTVSDLEYKCESAGVKI